MRQHEFANGYRHHDTRKTMEELDFLAACNMPPHVHAPAYAVSKAALVEGRVLDRSHRIWDFELKCFVFPWMPPVEPAPPPVVNLAPLLDRFKVSIRKRRK